MLHRQGKPDGKLNHLNKGGDDGLQRKGFKEKRTTTKTNHYNRRNWIYFLLQPCDKIKATCSSDHFACSLSCNAAPTTPASEHLSNGSHLKNKTTCHKIVSSSLVTPFIFRLAKSRDFKWPWPDNAQPSTTDRF